jgi:heat-inducible transcriptional repressor
MKPQRFSTAGSGDRPSLSEREQLILRTVVHRFIETASPVGSKALAQGSIALSPASIRNIMSDLEARGYLDHPHTSAGRVPTDLGYRTYVDDLMQVPDLDPVKRGVLRAEVERQVGDLEAVMRETARLMGQLTNLLGVVLSPDLTMGVLERLEAVLLSSERVMLIISVRGGIVRTIVAEVEAEIPRPALERIVAAINERLAGLTLEDIRRTVRDRVRDLSQDDPTGLVRVVLQRAPALFSDAAESRRAQVVGAQHLVVQPEFSEPMEVRNLVELLENEDVVVHLVEAGALRLGDRPGRAVVLIGSENAEERAENFSVVTARYRIGDTTGALGVIGPTRMDYGQVVALVEYVASLLSRAGERSEG